MFFELPIKEKKWESADIVILPLMAPVVHIALTKNMSTTTTKNIAIFVIAHLMVQVVLIALQKSTDMVTVIINAFGAAQQILVVDVLIALQKNMKSKRI